MEIPKPLQNQVIKYVSMEAEKVYSNILTKEEISSSLDNHFKEVFDILISIVDIDKEVFNPVVDRINKTKKRWLKLERESKNGLSNEIEVASQVFKMVNEDEDKFKLTFNVNNPEEFEVLSKKELMSWEVSADSLLGEFRYIKLKRNWQIISALKNDIEFLSYKYIKENIEKYTPVKISEMPQIVEQLPVDYTNKALIGLGVSPESLGVRKENEEYFMNKYYIGDSKVFESVVDAQILKTGTLRNAIKMLNSLDRKILLYLLSLRDELSFYSTREVVVNIGDIVSDCYKSKGAKNYLRVKESLYKMQYLTTGIVDSNLKGFTLKILDNVEIYGVDGKEVVKVIFNSDIVNDFINRKTINIYKDAIDSFKLPASESIIFRLQKERIAMYSKKSSDMSMKVNLNYFRACLYFSNKQKVKNIEIIENSLNEIINKKITLKSYKRKGDIFMLEFYPITDKERIDLLYSGIDDENENLIEGEIIEALD